MLLAEALEFRVNGIEYDKFNVKYSFYPSYKMTVSNHYWGHIIQGDAFDFTDYGKYDCVYFYCPIRNRELEEKLELLIEDNLKVGAIYIANGKHDYSIRKDKRFRSLKFLDNGYSPGYDHPIWQKIKN